jgi:alpha-L-arabinofuranosidase
VTATARLVLDPSFTIAEVDDRLYGSFVEHMGRAVYGGMYEPGHPTADGSGFRGDVAALVRELGVTTIRYPGGNFVSGYDWEDGVGPVQQRPVRLDLAWHSIEPNLIGTDEFVRWCRGVGAEPMLAVNLGTRGIDAARSLVEYCNLPAGSKWADLRIANGSPEPHRVGLWCVGNEMDGPWQIGHTDAAHYGALANETGKAMRSVDPSIELVVCGSSHSRMPTFGSWEDTVLDLCWDSADHISLHSYYDPDRYPNLDAFLACSHDLGRMIDSVAAISDSVAARRQSRKRIGLSVDEWMVWYQSGNPDYQRGGAPFEHAPGIAQDVHTVTDALVVGCLLITMLRRADRVRIACLAQLLNTIAPIQSRDGGPAWSQTTYFPFQHASRYGRGTVLRCEPEAPTFEVDGEGQVSVLEATAVAQSSGDEVTVFAVNRGSEALDLELVLRDLEGVAVREQIVLTDDDLTAANTAERPDRVSPSTIAIGSADRVTLAPRSWNVVRLAGS